MDLRVERVGGGIKKQFQHTKRDLYHAFTIIIMARGDFIQLKVANSFDLKCAAFCILSYKAVNKQSLRVERSDMHNVTVVFERA